MPDLIENILSRQGPCISTELAQLLQDQHGLTADAARQRISRHKNIKRLAYVTFPRNARFVYLQRDYGSTRFWDALTAALLNNTVAYGGALAALVARSGIMPLAHFSIACGAPDAQKRHLSPATIFQRLEKSKLLQTVELPGIGSCVSLAQQQAPAPMVVAEMRARLIVEDILLKAIKTWARQLGLASYDKIALRDEGPQQPRVGTFRWDLTGPCYLAPMLDWNAGQKLKPGFIACDVLLTPNVSAMHLKPFIEKCKTLRNLKSVGRCLQIFVAYEYGKDAFRLAKESGIIVATPATLFGDEVAAALVELTNFLTRAAASTVDPEQFDEIFRRLGKIEGAAINLRGALFEFMVVEIVRQTAHPPDMRMNEIIRNAAGKGVEVDVLAATKTLVRFIECKGYKPGGTVPDELIRTWLDERIDHIRQFALQHPDWKRAKLQFEFWSTGVLSPEAQKMIADAQAAVRATKYKIVLKDRTGVAEMGRETNDKALQRTLNEHFLEHPFETIERDLNKRSARQRRRDMQETFDIDRLLESAVV